MKEQIWFHCKNIHLDNGELAEGVLGCAPGKPLELKLGEDRSDSIKLSDTAHVSLGRFDPHVHFRESVMPNQEEFEEYGPASGKYQSLKAAVESANSNYSVRSGCLSALKGGVCSVGAMGNVPWGPVGAYRHEQMQSLYDENSLLPIIVWPRMEPGVSAIPGHEGKDFGSTFGGSGLTGKIREAMYAVWKGEAVSYHNDQARPDETIQEFKDRVQPEEALLHHEYFNGDTVLACQAETIEIAKRTGVSSLLARHIPTGPALQQILDTQREVDFAMPAEVGLDYVYWCRERLLQQDREVALINYRRPAHPSRADQLSLIETTRDAVRNGYDIFFGTDHAPHTLESKRFSNGLPGSPGTRNIEHSLQFYLELYYKYGYTWHDIDLLASINPAKRMARYRKYEYEVGTMAKGAMANLAIFDPTASYSVNERDLSAQLDDKHYHSALNGEVGLRGQSLFTVVNGRVYTVTDEIKALN